MAQLSTDALNFFSLSVEGVGNLLSERASERAAALGAGTDVDGG